MASRLICCMRAVCEVYAALRGAVGTIAKVLLAVCAIGASCRSFEAVFGCRSIETQSWQTAILLSSMVEWSTICYQCNGRGWQCSRLLHSRSSAAQCSACGRAEQSVGSYDIRQAYQVPIAEHRPLHILHTFHALNVLSILPYLPYTYERVQPSVKRRRYS